MRGCTRATSTSGCAPPSSARRAGAARGVASAMGDIPSCLVIEGALRSARRRRHNRHLSGAGRGSATRARRQRRRGRAHDRAAVRRDPPRQRGRMTPEQYARDRRAQLLFVLPDGDGAAARRRRRQRISRSSTSCAAGRRGARAAPAAGRPTSGAASRLRPSDPPRRGPPMSPRQRRHRTRGAFASMVAHELRTPLTAALRRAGDDLARRGVVGRRTPIATPCSSTSRTATPSGCCASWRTAWISKRRPTSGSCSSARSVQPCLTSRSSGSTAHARRASRPAST